MTDVSGMELIYEGAEYAGMRTQVLVEPDDGPVAAGIPTMCCMSGTTAGRIFFASFSSAAPSSRSASTAFRMRGSCRY